MCGCDQRRAALVTAGSSALRGDLTRIGPALRLVARTGVQDVAAMAVRMRHERRPPPRTGS